MDFSNIIKPGVEVRFKKQYGGMNGVVKAVWISEEGLMYQIAYIYNGEFKEPYVPRIMFEVYEETPMGFRITTNE